MAYSNQLGILIAIIYNVSLLARYVYFFLVNLFFIIPYILQKNYSFTAAVLYVIWLQPHGNVHGRSHSHAAKLIRPATSSRRHRRQSRFV